MLTARTGRTRLGALLYLSFHASVAFGAAAIVLDRTHESRFFQETRHYRIFLPPDYETSRKRYPVVYFFHGWGERYNQCTAGHNYDQGTDYGGDNFASFVGAHDLIVVRWDGYNPRTPGENYVRPYNIGPVETDRQFPLYFPELVRYIDATYRTIPDREHRGTSGLSMGGFMSSWVAGKYPDLVSSMSNFMGSSEFVVGPPSSPVEYRHEEMHNNYDGMRTRLIMGTEDFIQFYHRRMNLIWDFTQAHHESEVFKADHGTPGIAKTMSFHMRSFAEPLPRPAVWNHIDVYPEFSAWGWDVTTDRKEPGFTVLENVSASGFRSCVREWVPSGRILAGVQVKIMTPSSYRPGQDVTVNLIRLRDGQVRHLREKADSKGRLTLGLDGEEYEVGIGSAANLALAGIAVEGTAWATDAEPVRLRARFVNKGERASAAMQLRWETPNRGVRLDTATATLPALAPGRLAEVPLVLTVQDPTREIVKLFAVGAHVRLPLELPTFPPAGKTAEYRIADGLSLPVYQGGETVQQLTLGTGNSDGYANAGERIAILLPDGNAFRAAELFTNDACIDLSKRVSDGWGGYDHVGASAKISLPLIQESCTPGHVIRALARIQLANKPNHTVRYAVVEFPIK
jgi:poly(3-hydroxybutyrate) depolymerase